MSFAIGPLKLYNILCTWKGFFLHEFYVTRRCIALVRFFVPFADVRCIVWILWWSGWIWGWRYRKFGCENKIALYRLSSCGCRRHDSTGNNLVMEETLYHERTKRKEKCMWPFLCFKKTRILTSKFIFCNLRRQPLQAVGKNVEPCIYIH